MKGKRSIRRLASLAVAFAALLTISACGGGSAGGGGDGDGGDLLQEVKDRGVLRVSTDPAYPPQS
jgi:hypothetical protein